MSTTLDNELVKFTDPLIQLLHNPNINKEKSLSKELIEYINNINDKQLKNYCVKSLRILRDLEKIENVLNNWEFQTLEFNLTIDLNENDENRDENEDEKSLKDRKKIQLSLSNRVLNRCLELHKNLNFLQDEIDELCNILNSLTIISKISDSGTIFTELILRIIKLNDLIDYQISINYSKSKLVKIGSDLERLIKNDDGDGEGDFDYDIVINYKKFVNDLLSQLNGCVLNGDTVGAMECIAVVGDVEKMFESMKRKKESELGSSSGGKQEKKKPNDANDERDFKSNEISITNELKDDDELTRTTLTEQMPNLMNVFKEAKQTEEELKNVIALTKGDRVKPVSKKEMNENKNIEIETENNVPGYFPSFKPSIFNAFYQPVIEKPIYINTKPLQAQTKTKTKTGHIDTKPNLIKIDTDSALHVKQKSEQNNNDANRNSLLLSPEKIRIQLGNGRVKETVKVIEDQLPHKMNISSPLFASGNAKYLMGGIPAAKNNNIFNNEIEID